MPAESFTPSPDSSPPPESTPSATAQLTTPPPHGFLYSSSDAAPARRTLSPAFPGAFGVRERVWGSESTLSTHHLRLERDQDQDPQSQSQSQSKWQHRPSRSRTAATSTPRPPRRAALAQRRSLPTRRRKEHPSQERRPGGNTAIRSRSSQPHRSSLRSTASSTLLRRVTSTASMSPRTARRSLRSDGSWSMPRTPSERYVSARARLRSIARAAKLRCLVKRDTARIEVEPLGSKC